MSQNRGICFDEEKWYEQVHFDMFLKNQCIQSDPVSGEGERQGPTKAEDAGEILERTAACD